MKAKFRTGYWCTNCNNITLTFGRYNLRARRCENCGCCEFDAAPVKVYTQSNFGQSEDNGMPHYPSKKEN